MKKEKAKEEKKEVNVKCNSNRGGIGGGIYGFAFIGAFIYYLQAATTFWEGVLAFLKAIVWPAMLIYRLMEILKM